MFKNLRQDVSILTVVIIFLALTFAIGAEGVQTSKKSAKPTPTPKKNAKATLTPSKKTTAKATPTPKKSTATTTAKSKTADKKTPAKSSTVKKTDSKTQTSKDKGKTTTTAKNAKDTKAAAKNSATSKTTKDTKAKDTKATTKSSSTAKTTPTKKPTPAKNSTPAKTNDSAASSAQIMVTDLSARLRSQAKTSAPEVSKVKLGTTLNVVEKTPSWYRVQYTNAGKTTSGWIPTASVSKLDSSNKDQIYTQIVSRQYKTDGMDFASASAVYDFLTDHEDDFAGSSSASDLELKRLLALRAALKDIPIGTSKTAAPYAEFLKAHTKEIVYSEPSGQYLPASNLFWDLHKKYKDSPNADLIAWEGAQNPLPGECEGYVNCHLFYGRMTSGEYLNLHPSGKRNLEALTNLTNMLTPIVADIDAKSVYNGPTDVTDRAEFNNLLAELRTIVSRLPLTEKEKTLQQLKRIAEAFR